jgi:3-hydroxybutyryl-CoA dehydratase
MKLNKYVFNEIKIGLTESFSKKISEKEMRLFSILTGDINPLHTNKSFAKKKGFQDRIVYGMLTSSFLSSLAGMCLPGINSIIISVNINFLNPAIVGDTLNILGEVTEKKEFANLIKIDYTITNQENKIITRGNMLVKVSENNED